MFLIDTLILISSILLLLGIVSSKMSARLGVPVLVLFLLLGMLAGSEGIGGIKFENYALSHGIGTVALAMILFDGGLSTSLASVKLVWKPAGVLATLGVLLTAIITGTAASWILNISLMEGMLLGSIVGSTDAAAVFSVLRSGGIGLPKRISALLEVESASNDPMAIFLTIGCIEVLLGNIQFGPGLLALFLSQMFVGGFCGVLGGLAGGWLTNRIELAAAGMYPVLISAIGLLTFGVATQFQGSGFLAVYLAGVVMGNRPLVFQRGIKQFHDAIAWLSQIVMFVVLGLLCFPSRLFEVAENAILISIVLIFLARPIAVFLSATVFRFHFSWRELTFLSWVGLKGAVPITLAIFPLMLATPEKSLNALLIFDVVFFIVVLSATVQGMTLTPMARLLGLERPRDPEPPVALEISSLKHVNGQVIDYGVSKESHVAGRMVKDLALPKGAVIALIARGQEIIPPQGTSRIHSGDHVILVLRSGIQPLVDRVFRRSSERLLPISPTLEFPLRGSTTVEKLQENYELTIDSSSPANTLAEAIMQKLQNKQPEINQIVQIGSLTFKILRLDRNNRIELVAMSVGSENGP